MDRSPDLRITLLPAFPDDFHNRPVAFWGFVPAHSGVPVPDFFTLVREITGFPESIRFS
jgi:hypothetical protein